jgi:hypothetical protein
MPLDQLDQYTLLQIGLKIGAAILVFVIGRWLAGRAKRTWAPRWPGLPSRHRWRACCCSPPNIFVQALDDSSVNIAARPWVKSEDYWSLQWDMPERVKLRFDAEGITIPFPQRDVHVHRQGEAKPAG